MTPKALASRRLFTGLGSVAYLNAAAEGLARIVAVADANAEEHAAALREHGVVVWGRDSRLRASVHLYNDNSEVDRMIDALRQPVTPRSPA